MIAATHGSAQWYLTRSTGFVSLALLTCAVVLGIVTTVRWESPRWPRFVTAGLHRNVSLLVLVFLGIHIFTAVADSYAPIRWLDVVLPLASRYRPLWLGLGSLAFDVLLAVTLTSLVRRRLGYRAWRTVHWAAYACWPVALVHGLGTGTDTRSAWVVLANLASLGAVVAAVWWRLLRFPPEDASRRRLAIAAGVVLPVAIVVWLFAEPLHGGWARKAGTPAALLGTRPAAAREPTPSPSPTPAQAVLQPPFTARLTAKIDQTRADAAGRSTVTIDGDLSDGAAGRLHITMEGSAVGGRGIRLAQSSATLGPTTEPGRYHGQVTGLNGNRLVLTLRGPDNRSVLLSITLHIDETNRTVSGEVRATPGDGTGSGTG